MNDNMNSYKTSGTEYGKPRPLGSVKSQSIHFGDEAAFTVKSFGFGFGSNTFSNCVRGENYCDTSNNVTDTRNIVTDSSNNVTDTSNIVKDTSNNVTEIRTLVSSDLIDGGSRYKTSSEISCVRDVEEVEPMKDLQETLRQAALLGMVAAANHDEHHTMDPILPSPHPGDSGGKHTTFNLNTGVSGHKCISSREAKDCGHLVKSLHINPADDTTSTHSHSEARDRTIRSNNGCSKPSTTGVQSYTNSDPREKQQLSRESGHKLSHKKRVAFIPASRYGVSGCEWPSQTNPEINVTITAKTDFRASMKSGSHPLHTSFTDDCTPQTEIEIDEASDNNERVKNDSVRGREIVREISCIRGSGFASNRNGDKDTNNDTKINHDKKRSEMSDSQPRRKIDQREKHSHISKRKTAHWRGDLYSKKHAELFGSAAADTVLPFYVPGDDNAHTIIPNTSSQGCVTSSMADERGPDENLYSTRSGNTPHTTNADVEAMDILMNARTRKAAIDAYLNHNKAAKKPSLNWEDNLIIDGIYFQEASRAGTDWMYRTHKDAQNVSTSLDVDAYQLKFHANTPHNIPKEHSSTLTEVSPFFDTNTTQPLPRVLNSVRRRPLASKLSKANQIENSTHPPSLTALTDSSTQPDLFIRQLTTKCKTSDTLPEIRHDSRIFTRQNVQNSDVISDKAPEVVSQPLPKIRNGNTAASFKPSLFMTKPNPDHPILRTELVDHFRCIGLVDQRVVVSKQRKPTHKRFHSDGAQDSDLLNHFDEEENTDIVSPTNGKETAEYNDFHGDESREDVYSHSESTRFQSNVQKPTQNFNDEFLTSFDSTDITFNRSTTKKKPSESPSSASDRIASHSTHIQDFDEPSTHFHEESRSTRFPEESESPSRTRYEPSNRHGRNGVPKVPRLKLSQLIDEDVYSPFQHKKFAHPNNTRLHTTPGRTSESFHQRLSQIKT